MQLIPAARRRSLFALMATVFFIMKKPNRELAKTIGGVFWETFRKEYEEGMKGRILKGNYGFRGFYIIGWLCDCLRKHTFKTFVDLRDAFLESTDFDKCIFEAGASV